MSMVADEVEFVIGVDTHKHGHSAAIVDRNGAVLAEGEVGAHLQGYRQLRALAESRAAGRRLWAVEGSGSYGTSLTSFLLEHGEKVAEIDRPRRQSRRNGAKSDQIDAIRAAREALARPHLAQPRARGDREALRVLLSTREQAVGSHRRAMCHLKSLATSAPEGLRVQLLALSDRELLTRCSRLRATASHSLEQRATATTLRLTAHRALQAEADADGLALELELIVKALAPRLLALHGIGVISAAEIVCAWSHQGRIRSEAAFAMLAGVCPIPASSGQTVRHRLNRRGDRRLNRALHFVALSRMLNHQPTRSYVQRRRAEGRSDREIRRCLKRYLARQIFRVLEACPA
jgi:transposase